jgi:hypothetical protein
MNIVDALDPLEVEGALCFCFASEDDSIAVAMAATCESLASSE